EFRRVLFRSPVPDVVDKSLAAMAVDNKPLTESLALQLTRQTSVDVPAEAWQPASLDNFYRFNIKVVDDRGRCIASGRDLQELRTRYREQVQQNIQSAATNIEREDIQSWDFDDLPQSVQLQRS